MVIRLFFSYVIIKLGDNMKNILKVLVLSYLLIFVTGCMEFDAEMEIKKDKSMTLTITEMVDTNYSNSDIPYFNDSDIKKYKDCGFDTYTNTVDDMTGHVLTKHFTNIDTVSSTEQVNSKDATKALLGDSDYIFTVKKGIFRNKYVATFNVGDFIDKFNTNGTSLSGATLDFKLRLPYKVITSNATSVSSNGKNLDWNLKNLATNQIYFEFTLYNLTNVYIVAGGILLVGLLMFSEYRDKKIAKSFYKRK